MKNFLSGVAVVLLGFSFAAYGQAIPAGTGPAPSLGFQLPTIGGTLNYSVSASESISKGFYEGSNLGASTNISGNVGFVTKSERHPFSLVYSGGYFFGNTGNYPSSFFQSLAFSQVLTAGRWNFVVADSVSYLPQSPSAGLSGIPGVGDLGLDPVQVGSTGALGILTYYGPRVSNTVSGSASRPITPSLSFQGSGNYSTLRYLGNTSDSSAVNGLDNTSEGGSGGLNYRIDARNNVGANYTYSRYSFSSTGPAFITQGLSVYYSRLVTRRLSVNVSGGPQRSSSSNSAFSNPSISLGAGAGLVYSGKTLVSSVNYFRGVSNGYGVIPGAISDSLVGGVRRTFGRSWSASGSIGYSRSKSLPTLTAVNFSSDAGTAGAQVSRVLGKYFSAFVSYNVQDQRVTSSYTGLNAFDGIFQTFGFGVTYSPSSINLGRR